MSVYSQIFVTHPDIDLFCPDHHPDHTIECVCTTVGANQTAARYQIDVSQSPLETLYKIEQV
jgi:hypothetical protein